MSNLSTHRRRAVWVVAYRGRSLVKLEGNAQPENGATQSSAMAYARSLAKHNGCELIVQARNGRIRVKDSHGRDSRRRKG